MKFSDMVRVKSNKKYKCLCCGKEIGINKVGLASDEGVVCNGCTPAVSKRKTDLMETFMSIHNRYPTQDNINAINKLALQIGG